MIPVLLLFIPLVAGILGFFVKEQKGASNLAIAASVVTLLTAVVGIYAMPASMHQFEATWLPSIGASFSVSLDGMSKMLVLLTAISMPLILIATRNNNYTNAGAFYALMSLAQAGLMGVFISMDALLFYFFWELALIPVYFLCSIWGGEKRIAVTFKFFIYTFIGSLLMLVGILLVYLHTKDHSFAWSSFTNTDLTSGEETLPFFLFFIAFAIKMPIFPLHTWQPDAYEQAPTATTMVLSGVMVKMGLFAVIRWVLPMFPFAVSTFAMPIIIVSVVGMIYASLIAIQQDDIKRLIAYSSIAHIGLMAAAIFAGGELGLQGVQVQMFNHGINVIGLWIIANAIESTLGTRKLSELGGLATKAPTMAILFVVLAFANIALPLTNAFIGEFLLFNGLFQYNIWIAAVAGVSIILGAVYTLQMVQKVLFGDVSAITANATEINSYSKWVLIVIVVCIVALGVYPQPLIDLTKDSVNALLVIK
jgi:NADH-quinone oxidoreductase subunit M